MKYTTRSISWVAEANRWARRLKISPSLATLSTPDIPLIAIERSTIVLTRSSSPLGFFFNGCPVKAVNRSWYFARLVIIVLNDVPPKLPRSPVSDA